MVRVPNLLIQRMTVLRVAENFPLGTTAKGPSRPSRDAGDSALGVGHALAPGRTATQEPYDVH
jgi:hypothetical protein